MATSYSRRFLEMGICNSITTGMFNSCAWEKDDCNNSTHTFVAHEQSDYTRYACNPSDQPVGRCLSEDQCAVRSSDCERNTTSANFKSDDDTCTMQRDKALEWDTENPAFTQFGSCLDTTTNEYFCIYYPTDCDESGTEVYVNPTDTLAAGVTCDCSQVHVTACIGSRGYCALNENGCRDDGYEVAFSPFAQKSDREGTKGIDCRLCRKRNTMTPTPAPTTFLKPTKYPTYTPTRNPIEVTSLPTLSPTRYQDISPKKGFDPVITVCASVVGWCSICFLIYMYCKLFRGAAAKKRAQAVKDSRIKPPRRIAFSEDDSMSIASSIAVDVESESESVSKLVDESLSLEQEQYPEVKWSSTG